MSKTQTRNLNGTAVRVIREAYGVSNGVLAQRSKISAPFLSRLEAGARQASPTVQRALADGLQVPLEAITYPVNTESAA